MSMLDFYTTEIRHSKDRKLDYKRAYSIEYALFANKVINLFKWSGLPFNQREIETRLQLFDNGLCGIVRSPRYNKIIAARAAGYGVTEYPDQWNSIIWTCPGDSGNVYIGDDSPAGVLARNNDMMLPTAVLIDKYSHMLAHAALSLQAILINIRATGIMAAKDDKQKQNLADFYLGLEDGKTMAIVDDAGLDTLLDSQGLRHISTSYPNSSSIMDLWQIRENLYKEFLQEIGISKRTDKKERLITDEVAEDEPLRAFNIDDMLNCRKEAAEKINRVFGLNVSVKINPTISGGDENETNRTTDDNASSVGSGRDDTGDDDRQ